ncbi:uncharacterized protein (DUF305 family) [Actinoplanes tereljensis]|uniref:DUF305 domain-containing protein n=1 Tax=Paractinoplanes tereljensis TaxID=571912 RepID=A0A919TWN4_9ACTN|nr:DUF305 domain-containing protein [Actinoplanes tereljensis]GIF25326.1 hypothetical protein Ate02nite_80560 [Actinoplanes tereljensis]
MRRASIVLVAALIAAGCGSTPAPTPASPAATAEVLGPGPRHNAADVAFVSALIPHHRAGIALAGSVATNPDARTLAEAIIVTQQDEVVRMTDWLRVWGANPPASTPPGSAPAAPVRALIAHQEEAVRLAQQEQANGANPTALAYAEQIVESRTAQIEQLRQLHALA